MLDSFMDMLAHFAQTLHDQYFFETLGAFLILLLLLVIVVIWKKMRKRRKKRSMGEPLVPAPEHEHVMPEHHPETREIEPGEGEPVPKPVGFMERLKTGLGKTRRSLTGRIDSILAERSVTDEETLEDLEEVLITSDMGVETTMMLMEKVRRNAPAFNTADDLREFLKSEMRGFLTQPRENDLSAAPYVIMVVGVNGVGKTTTIGKLAYKYRKEGKTVLLGAADTFRAAAVEQLHIWAQRSGSDIVHHRDNADPAAVAYDAVEAGVSRKSDVIIVDTAGRLQTRVNLMEELKKIKRSIAKRIPEAPHEVLLVLDATTGQNAISQAKTFYEGIGVTSLALTKLDGTAKGGIVVGICNAMKLPIQYIGVGEQIDDLQPFDPDKFIDAIF